MAKPKTETTVTETTPVEPSPQSGPVTVRRPKATNSNPRPGGRRRIKLS